MLFPAAGQILHNNGVIKEKHAYNKITAVPLETLCHFSVPNVNPMYYFILNH